MSGLVSEPASGDTTGCLRRHPVGACLVALAAGLAGLLVAVAAGLVLAQPAAAEKRVALVIGNSAYTNAGELPNPANDARDMAEVLKSVGIEVILGLDLDKRAFDAKVHEFSRALVGADVGLLFYAGHGLQVGLRNYLVPVDARLQGERDLDFETVGLDFVMRQMELDREGKTTIVFLDACRDNPLARNLARTMGTRSVVVGRGLAEVQGGVGTFIAYSTKPGDVAADGTGRNSPFTAALTKAVRTPGKSLTALMVDVRKEVLAATANRQVPWDHSALTGDFYFQPASAPGMLSKTAPVAPPSDSGALQERLRQLEDELKRKSDPQLTVKLVEMSQLKERVRQLEEANRQDQQLIFDTQDKYRTTTDRDGQLAISREIGNIQIRMAQRNDQARGLREQITKLEKEVGSATPASAK
ncbi:MAG: caspase family protein [Hyphomicrobiaceae bacterium]|nr:caspase family protein [Hyphomicrobiaceae bacterium]